MPSPREQLASALDQFLTPEQMTKLIDEVLAIEKKGKVEFSCKHCGRRQYQFGMFPDAKAVALALPDLLNQAYGRPQEANQVGDPVVFKRLTVTDTDEELHDALRAVEENRRRHQSERRQDGAVHSRSNGKRNPEAPGNPDLQELDPRDDQTEEIDA